MIHTEAGAPPPAPAVRLAAIRRLLLDDALTLEDRIAGCLVLLYGQQASRIASLRITEVSCTDAATRLKLGADWLDVPEPVATLLRHHLRTRGNMTTAANPASPWLFPGQFAGEHRSYRRLIAILNQMGIPARASRQAAWHQLIRQAPPAVLADALGVSPDTATRHALHAGTDWATYASRRPSPATPEYEALSVSVASGAGNLQPCSRTGRLPYRFWPDGWSVHTSSSVPAGREHFCPGGGGSAGRRCPAWPPLKDFCPFLMRL